MKVNEPSRGQSLPRWIKGPTPPAKGLISDIPAAELKRLLDLRHQNPHSILGAHPTDRGVIVRT